MDLICWYFAWHFYNCIRNWCWSAFLCCPCYDCYYVCCVFSGPFVNISVTEFFSFINKIDVLCFSALSLSHFYFFSFSWKITRFIKTFRWVKIYFSWRLKPMSFRWRELFFPGIMCVCLFSSYFIDLARGSFNIVFSKDCWVFKLSWLFFYFFCVILF